MRVAWTKEEDDVLKSLASDRTKRFWVDDAAAKIGRSKASVQCRAKRIGIIRKSLVNEHYFSEYNHDTCYAAGYICADGSIDGNKGCPKSRLKLRCSHEDDYIIHGISEKIGGHRIQKDVPPKVIEFSGSKKGEICSRGLSSISINGVEFVRNLENYFGVVPNKSHVNPEYPSIPDEFFGSFLRGVFDGDGTIGLNGRGECDKVAIYGSDKFLIGLAEQASRVLGIRKPPLGRNRSLGRIAWCSMEDIIAIYKAFYADPSWIWLERKRQKMHTTLIAKRLREIGIVPPKKEARCQES